MFKKAKPFITFGFVLACALIIVNTTFAQEQGDPYSCDHYDDARYFEETGHIVCGHFLEFFETRGGQDIFGYPSSRQFIEDGRLVQYFQRVRMEYHPENPEYYIVQLGLLGDLLGYRQPPIDPSEIPNSNAPSSQYFPETGHVVKYAFLRFYQENGGLDIFGYPTSPWHYEGDLIVQYFQRAKMEWHPESSEFQVQLGNLGQEWVNRPEFPKEYLDPDFSDPGIMGNASPKELIISASVAHAFTGRGGYQTIFVYVNDQQDNSVENAAINVTVHFHSGDSVNPCPMITNDEGFSKCTFPLGNPLSGYIVVIDVTASFAGLEGSTQTSFLPWW